MKISDDHKDAEEMFEQAFDILVEDTNYIASSKESRERNAPSPEWLELIVWNVLVSFLINVLSGLLTDKILKSQKMDKQEDAIIQLKAELIDMSEKYRNERDKYKKLMKAVKIMREHQTMVNSATSYETIQLISDILSQHGWPKELSRKRAKEIAKIISEEVYGKK